MVTDRRWRASCRRHSLSSQPYLNHTPKEATNQTGGLEGETKEATNQTGGLEGESAGLAKQLGGWGGALSGSAWEGARAIQDAARRGRCTALAWRLRGGGVQLLRGFGLRGARGWTRLPRY
eukprot:5942811-Prymnesium_polylepis.1